MLFYITFSNEMWPVFVALLLFADLINFISSELCIKYLVDFEELEEREDKMDVQERDHL